MNTFLDSDWLREVEIVEIQCKTKDICQKYLANANTKDILNAYMLKTSNGIFVSFKLASNLIRMGGVHGSEHDFASV